MRIHTILTNLFSQNNCKIHRAHTNFLSLATQAVLSGSRLTCASLGRNLATNTTQKHNIKRVNNMLGNPNLHKNRVIISQAITHFFLNVRQRPIIIVDWSSTNSSLKFHVLRATLIIRNKGRGITLYEEVHPQKKLANPKVEQAFLYKLKDLIPGRTKPIIVTDAGYHIRWFKVVKELNWDYLGRARGGVQYKICKKTRWLTLNTLFKKATTTAKFIDNFLLSKNREWSCRAVLVKQSRKRTKSKTVTGKIACGTANRKNAKRAREPWLLITSLTKLDYSARQIANIYERRMQIEEGFRDSKSSHYGMGLKSHRSKSAARIEILLLISMLTTFIGYAIGYAAQQLQLNKHFQANTMKARQVISFIFLATQIYKCRHKEKWLMKIDFSKILDALQRPMEIIL